MGVVTVGAAVGGICFSLVLQQLFDSYDWHKSMIILTSILAVLLVVGNIFVGDSPSRGLEASRGRWRDLADRKFFLFMYCVFGTHDRTQSVISMWVSER